MKRLMVSTGFAVLLLSTKSHAQSGAVIPSADAGHAPQASCVILKRMGRGDRTKTRLYSFGISGKQFRYVEGKLPEGFSLHRKMTEHDVRNLQSLGAQVMVLEEHYTPDDLKEARAACHGQSAKTPALTEAKATPEPASALIASTPAPAPMPPAAKTPTLHADGSAPSSGVTDAALLDISSSPPEADVYIDERFSGRTPSTTIILMPGDHKIAIKKIGFAVWQRKFKLPSGHNSVYADLVPKAK